MRCYEDEINSISYLVFLLLQNYATYSVLVHVHVVFSVLVFVFVFVSARDHPVRTKAVIYRPTGGLFHSKNFFFSIRRVF